MSKTVKRSSTKKPAKGKKVIKAKKAGSSAKKKTAASPKKKIVKKAKPAKVKKAAVAKKVTTKKAITKKATKVAPKKIAKAAPKKTIKAAPKKPAVTKNTVKKAIAHKTKLAGGLIVRDLPVKKAEVPAKPLSPLLKAIIEGLEEKKAKNIMVIDLHKIQNRSFDHFVIADADSSTHVEAIAAAVEEEVKKKTGERPYHSEGWQNAEWILLDYINVVVHVFQRPIREFYNIEGLWADAEIQKIN